MKIKQLLKNQEGSMYIGVIITAAIIFMLMLVIAEVLKVHTLHEHLSDELYRAANLAIKTAMYDSYRIDATSKFDEQIALNAFYSYLNQDLELNSNYEKIEEDGDVAYMLTINDVEVDGDNVRMKIKATAYAPPLFNLWGNKWEIPIEVVSRNIRTD